MKHTSQNKFSIKAKKVIIRTCIILAMASLILFTPIFNGDSAIKWNQSLASPSTNTYIPVECIMIELNYHETFVDYIGIVQPIPIQSIMYDELKLIEEIYVQQGESIKIGDKLVKMFSPDLSEDFNIEETKLETAEALRDSTKEALDESSKDNKNYTALKIAYEDALDEYDYQQEKYDELKDDMDEFIIYSHIDGYVAQLMAAPDTYAYPYNPLMILSSGEIVTTIGLTLTDYKKVDVGTPVDVIIDDVSFPGGIISINKLPDETSRTYEANITLDDKELELIIGDTANVSLHTGENSGIWIPIKVILNDGQDYVYLHKDTRAIKKYIDIISISNDLILVDGLQEGDFLVSDGVKNIKAGSLLDVTNIDID